MENEIYMEFEDFVKKLNKARTEKSLKDLYRDCIDTGINKQKALFSDIFLRILKNDNIPIKYRNIILSESRTEIVKMKVFKK